MQKIQNCAYRNFLFKYEAKNIVFQKNMLSKDNPSCIDLFITNFPKIFQNKSTITTGMSDFNKMVITVLKTTYAYVAPILLFSQFQGNSVVIKKLTHLNY